MSSPERSIEALLRWRLARAQADAPPPPSARELLELARPWWERWPERFHAHLDRLARAPLALGYAMTAGQERGAHPVPTLVVRDEEVVTWARVAYLVVRDGRLRMRFRLDAPATPPEPELECTFVADPGERPLFVAQAELSQSGEYRIDVALPADLAAAWAELRVTERMPFRLILHPVPDAA